MTPDERAALEVELAALRRKLEKRRDMAGFSANMVAIAARISEIEATLGGG